MPRGQVLGFGTGGLAVMCVTQIGLPVLAVCVFVGVHDAVFVHACACMYVHASEIASMHASLNCDTCAYMCAHACACSCACAGGQIRVSMHACVRA